MRAPLDCVQGIRRMPADHTQNRGVLVSHGPPANRPPADYSVWCASDWSGWRATAFEQMMAKSGGAALNRKRRGECAFSRANAISRAFLGGTVFPSFLLFVCCYSFISPRATAVARCCRTGALVLWKRTRVRSINDVMSARSGGRSAGLYDATVLNNFFSL